MWRLPTRYCHVGWVSLVFTTGLILNSANSLQKPFRDVETLEEHLISLSKFVDCSPTQARKLLSTFKVQAEDVTFRRLSDVINLQREALFNTAWKPWAEGKGLTPSDRIGLLEQIKDNKEREAASKELDALRAEVITRKNFPLFWWNQLRTDHPEGYTFDAKVKPSLNLCTWRSGYPEVTRKTMFNTMLSMGMTGRYFVAFNELIFEDEDERKIAKEYKNKAMMIYVFFGATLMAFASRSFEATETT